MEKEKIREQNRKNFKTYYKKHKDVQAERNREWGLKNRERLNYLKSRHSTLVYIENYASLEVLKSIKTNLEKAKKEVKKHEQ